MPARPQVHLNLMQHHHPVAPVVKALKHLDRHLRATQQCQVHLSLCTRAEALLGGAELLWKDDEAG